MTDIAEILKLKVTPHDQLTYLVTSSRGKKQYLVDLLANQGAGQCACPQWEIRIKPFLQTEAGRLQSCKHVTACWIWLARGMISQLIKSR